MGKQRRSLRPREVIALWEKHKHRCYWCDDELIPEQATFDHYEPIHRGGVDDPSNLVLSCFRCNATKATLPARVAELWLREGQPRCWAVHIWEFEERLPHSRDVWFVGAEYVQLEDGKRRVVDLPMGGGSCDDDRCPDCA